jgi:ABC-2 type transport system ATP-binding protein
VTYGATDLTVRFGSVTALVRVTLDVAPGEVAAVVGGDGAGKSTLLRALVGAVAPSDGVVRRPPAARIGFLASTSGTYPDLSVDENLEFSATAYGLARREARTRAADYLERTGLAEVRDRLAGDLSGGMRQKLGVIRALVHQPELVVLDEPTTGVDPVSRADLWWLIARAAAGGAAVVFATTYLDEAERAARVLVLDAGEGLVSGTPRDIIAATPGTVTEHAERPVGGPALRTWRRRTRWRTWSPRQEAVATSTGAARDVVQLDLQDAVTVYALDRERARRAAGATR